jgi:hypothetical protein
MRTLPELEIKYEGHGLYALYVGDDRITEPCAWDPCADEYELRGGL